MPTIRRVQEGSPAHAMIDYLTNFRSGLHDTTASWRRQWRESMTTADKAHASTLAARRSRYGTWWVVLLVVAGTIVIANVLSVVMPVLVVLPPLSTHPHIVQDVLLFKLGRHLTSAQWHDYATVTGANPALSGAGFVVLSTAYVAVPTAGLVWWMRRRLRWPWRDLGFVRLSSQDVSRSIFIGLCYVMVVIVATALVGVVLEALDLNNPAHNLAAFAPLRLTQGLVGVLYVLIICLTAPVVEEVFWRGYVFRALTTRYSAALGYAVSSLLFGLVHANQYTTVIPTISQATTGLILALAYHREGNMLTNITAHVTYDTLILVLYVLGLS